jgi:hypothetical protein
MPKKSFIVCNQLFPTKTALEDYLRALVARYADHTPLDSNDFEFVVDLLRLHPKDKIKGGIQSIHIAPPPDYPKTRCFWLTYLDGSTDNVSWGKCLSPPSPERKLAYACRRAVDGQISWFRQRFFDENLMEESRCPITGEALQMGDCDVDHEKPNTFEALVAMFLSNNAVEIASIEYSDDGNFADPALLAKWAKFHETHCRLRVVSRRANRSVLRKASQEAVAFRGGETGTGAMAYESAPCST